MMEPVQGIVTVEKVAANAVMAGCVAEYFPVVLAAVRAVLQPQFHVGSGACTTGGAAPVVIVSGSLAEILGINSRTACFGGNIKANATIGRALRLSMRNLGGAKPDGMEKSTLAWPGKISMCFAENEARSPWEPFRVDRGFAKESTTVSVVAARGLYPLTEGVQNTGLGVLETVAAGMRMVGAPIYYQERFPSSSIFLRSTRTRSRAPGSQSRACATISSSTAACPRACCATAATTPPVAGRRGLMRTTMRRWCRSSRRRIICGSSLPAATAATAPGCPPGTSARARPRPSSPTERRRILRRRNCCGMAEESGSRTHLGPSNGPDRI